MTIDETFEIVIDGTPVSNQARRRERVRAWIARVAAEAGRSWPDHMVPWPGPVTVVITHFFADVPIDLDNLAKPILDGIKGILIEDDLQVVELILRRYRTVDVMPTAHPSPLVAGALARSPEFIHIWISRSSNVGAAS